VVHMSSGYAALIAAIYLGRRMRAPADQESGMFQDIQEPANVPIVMLGTAFLWFGWFGVSVCWCLAAGSTKSQAWPTPCFKHALLLIIGIGSRAIHYLLDCDFGARTVSDSTCSSMKWVCKPMSWCNHELLQICATATACAGRVVHPRNTVLHHPLACAVCCCRAAVHSSMLAVLVVLDTLLAWPSSTPRLLLRLPC
jgi:hypothetical protein